MIALRDDKLAIIEQLRGHVSELKKLQRTMSESDRLPIPVLPKIHTEEEPER